LDVVKSQWPDEYDKFSGGSVKVQYLKGAKKMDPTADVYIVGIKKVLNIADKELSLIGTVIVDEAHISTVTAFTQSLLKFRPRYLVGLSATYDRSDGLHKLLYPYYGTPDNFIIRKEKKVFTVYKVQTPYEPRIKYVRKNGQRIVDWATVIKSIEENPLRWQNVVDVLSEYPEEKIIVMCNRQVQAKGVYALCVKNEMDAVLVIGDTKEWDKSKRIIITSFKKGGVGLNIPDLTFAIIASDTSDVRQYEGRIRTTNNIIYHFVDHYEAFEKHYKVCEKWYRDKGATIHTINI
jgi:superfamily II DNA or RNA helicase